MIASQTFADMNQLYEVFRMLRITMKERLIFGFSSFLTCEYNKNGKRVQAQPSENECNYNVAEKGDMPRERIVKILPAVSGYEVYTDGIGEKTETGIFRYC